MRVDYTNGSKTGYDTTIPCEWTVTPISNQFKIKVTDSRTFTMTDTYYKTMIDYEPIDILSVTFSRISPTSSDIKLNAEIKYIQATFGSTPNVPTIKWKKGETGTLNTLSSGDYTIDTQNNKITITNLTLTNVISYQDEARFYFYVEDLLTQDEDSHNYVTKGIPTFDAGERDFQVNGDLFIADTTRQNAVNVKDTLTWLKTQNVLWNGVWYMTANQIIDLSNTPISSQPHGIVLLWSAYEDGEAKNWDWVCNFIPKEFVNVYGTGNGMIFSMMSPTFSNIGSKYLYIANNSITGFSHNNATGTNSGITYKNNYWVLRYVIGV